jgi:hypothetical protein
MLVGCNEEYISKLVFQIYPKSFYSVAHRVGGCDSRQVHEETWDGSLLLRLFEIIVIV